jgi:hypothetical protein
MRSFGKNSLLLKKTDFRKLTLAEPNPIRNSIHIKMLLISIKISNRLWE